MCVLRYINPYIVLGGHEFMFVWPQCIVLDLLTWDSLVRACYTNVSDVDAMLSHVSIKTT